MPDTTPARMTAAALQATREHLGISLQTFAALLGVKYETARKWESGRDPIPPGAAADVARIETDTREVEQRVLELLDRADDPTIRVHRTDDVEGAGAVPDLVRQYGARWWRQLAARVAREHEAQHGAPVTLYFPHETD